MLRQSLKKLVPLGNAIVSQSQRNIGASAALTQKGSLDPIQQLFVDKIREYRTRSAGGKLVDASPETEGKLNELLGNLERAFGARGVDMTQFPTFNFAEPQLVWPGLTQDQINKVKETIEAEAEKERLLAAEKAEEVKPEYFDG
ncbi:unnamed protein product [Candidula unifasciata]|uniref:ATP synthase-coupling factor 6, mitochondrial n=1 Tax=Candidula unifasciata TaxID=100452 RepID=A0A8S3YSY3_9EUPU|nr:unnamed protein product [Candidula unifasciata]